MRYSILSLNKPQSLTNYNIFAQLRFIYNRSNTANLMKIIRYLPSLSVLQRSQNDNVDMLTALNVPS